MKRIAFLLFSLFLILCLVSCSGSSFDYNNDPTSSYDAVINKSITALKSEWKGIYNEFGRDGYFEIKNTRVIEIKDNDISAFKDVKYIVEFILFTDYYGSAPYYSEAVVSNVAVIYKNGNAEITGNLFRRYSSATYSYDYSDIIKNIVDCGDKYNLIEYLK